MDHPTRLEAFGLLTDDAGRMLLRHAPEALAASGSWWPPGGGVAHGEDPADAVVRWVSEQTGLDVAVAGIRDAGAAVAHRPDRDEHRVFVVYDLKACVGAEIAGAGADGYRNLWRFPADTAEEPKGSVAAILGQPGTAIASTPPAPPTADSNRDSRIGAYGWLTGPDGRVLLTMVPDGYWASGHWHLPGGGIDFGEQPIEAVRREIFEETNQEAQIGALRQVTSIHHSDRLLPDGRVIDFHGISLVYEARVTALRPLEILDVGGSTSQVAWFEIDEIAALTKTAAVAQALAARTG